MKKNWTLEEATDLFEQPFIQLLHQAQTVHQEFFPPNAVQISTLLSIETGRCPENCAYCPQSAHYQTGVKKEPLMAVQEVVEAAQRAKEAGATRFCMGAAWRGPREDNLSIVCQMVEEVKKLGMETCVTLGLLKEGQAERLKASGLDFYNHNIDTSREFYEKIITTRTFDDRLKTLEAVRQADLRVCCGGIIGMGETQEDWLKMLVFLANLDPQPESVPLNKLIKIPGTPLADTPDVDPFDFVRVVCVARLLMGRTFLRLSAGRESMSDELQALCFMAGINSIFYGEKLLTAENPRPEKDLALMKRLGLNKMAPSCVA